MRPIPYPQGFPQPEGHDRDAHKEVNSNKFFLGVGDDGGEIREGFREVGLLDLRFEG